MGYRPIPFGYFIDFGKTRINEQEAETVRTIFRDYIGGISLKTAAEKLIEQKTEYQPGKYSWNKNRIQRILTDRRYLGTEAFGRIVSKKIFDQAQEIMLRRNTQKGYCRREVFSSAVVPILCGKCGYPTARVFDSRYKKSVKHICSNPGCKAVYPIKDSDLWAMVRSELASAPSVAQTPSAEALLELKRLNNEIERDFERLDIDGEGLKNKILAYAALQYEALHIPPAESMDSEDMNPCSQFFIKEIQSKVSAVLLTDAENIRLRLINGHMTRREIQNDD